MCSLYIANDIAPVPSALAVSLVVLVALVHASIIDFKIHSVSNKFVFTLSVIALTISLAVGGVAGIATSIGSLCLLLAIVLPMFYSGGMGGGDVKLLGSISLLLSPANTVMLVLCTFIFGGLTALLYQLRPLLLTTFQSANTGHCRPAGRLATLPDLKSQFKSRRAVPFVPAITTAFAVIVLVDQFGVTAC